MNYNFNNQFNQYSRRPAGRQGNIFDGILRFFKGKSVLSRLILINIAVFVAAGIVRLVFYLYNQTPFFNIETELTWTAHYLAVPSDLSELASRPWTVFTYMFFQENFWHIFFNMLVLYVGGVIFKEYLGGKKLLLTYILGGITGAIFYIAAFNSFPVFADRVLNSVALGASASVMAIIVAVATYVPDYSIRLFLVGNVKFKWIAVFYIILDVLSIEKGNAGGHIAHLGGAFWGFIYILSLKKGLFINRFIDPFKKMFRTKPRVKTTYNRKPKTDDQYSYDKMINQKKTDEILDKIKRSGYESLSKEDKEFLFSQSNRKI